MNEITTHSKIETQLAATMRGFIGELRLVDLAHYVSYIQMDRFDCLADIVGEASQLYFAPDFLQLEKVASVSSDWGTEASVSLNISFNGARARNVVNIVLYDTYATIKLLHTTSANSDISQQDLEDSCCREIEENYLGKVALGNMRPLGEAILSHTSLRR
ncbi:hypothetical protein [Ahrensia kielensis]|jgi:hypothetical protein|uniref:hypothetical protein n=1 Tax=Ahrensia kielensis TaxID=76980 RepID=UPI00036865F6|nr:hypothetical protein [Ahrensia kielensis]